MPLIPLRRMRGPLAGRWCLPRPAAWPALLVLLLCGCIHKDYRGMDAIEKAEETRELRDEAQACYERFRRSQDDASEEVDLEALECFVDTQRLTTELHPSPMQCPECYRRYALGLRLLGIYWGERREEAETAIAGAPPAEVAELERAAREADDKVREYFQQSNEALESYFATRQSIDPRTYDWASQQYAELGDYRRALRYLDLLERSTRLNEHDRKVVQNRRRAYRELEEQRQFETLRAEEP